jgi:predicted alpha/beta hydrolase
MLDFTTPEKVSKIRFMSAGHPLSGRIYTPEAPARAVVVLNGATGVPQSYYAPFAHWLAEEKDLAVLTFDYNGIGASASGNLRDNDATMVTWGVTDQTAARDAARYHFPGLPIWIIGHSLGGMMLPFQKRIDDIERVIAVSSGAVHTGDHPWPFRASAMVFWSWPLALLTRALGYMPSHLLNMGEQLPAGVFLQWRDWCSRRGYYFKDIGRALPQPDWSRATAPVRLVSLADDTMMPPHCTARLKELYRPGQVDHVTLSPSSFGLKSVGHIAAFSRGCSALWPSLLGDT